MSEGRRTHRIPALVALTVALLALGGDVAAAQSAPQTGTAPPSLTRKYPLGGKRLCCKAGAEKPRSGAAPAPPAAPASPAKPTSGGKDHGSFGLASILVIAALVVLLLGALAFALRRREREKDTPVGRRPDEMPIAAAPAAALVPAFRASAPPAPAPPPRTVPEPAAARTPPPRITRLPQGSVAAPPAPVPTPAPAPAAVVRGRRRTGGIAGALRERADELPALRDRINGLRGGRGGRA